MNLRRVSLGIALSLGLSAPLAFRASAADFPAGVASDPKQDPAAIAFLRTKGYSVGPHFDAGHGMTGWVVVHAGNPNIIFTPPDGQVALIGAMVDTGGTNLTAALLEHYGANPGLPKAYDALGDSKYVAVKAVGAPRRIVYVVFDANCPYCSVIYRSTQKFKSAGVEFRWVPVAYLAADSATRAAAIVGAADPVKALDENENGFDEAKHAGGIKPSTSVPAAVQKQLEQDDAIMQSIDSTVTPTFVWKDEAGQVRQYQGVPPPDAMTAILGVAAPR